MKKIILILLVLSVMQLAFTGCATAVSSSTGTTTTTTDSVTNSTSSTGKAIVLADGTTETITQGGSYSVSGTLADGQLVVDTTGEVTLELAGVSITNSKGAALQINNAKQVTINLKSGTTNTLIDGGDSEFNATIFSNDTLIFDGEGSLTMTGNQAHGIESDDDVIINGGNITITAVKDGIHAKDNLTINGGVIDIPNAYEGLESKGDLIINDGEITILCSDDGLNAATDITLNGGTVYIKTTKGDAIDSNGPINMNGGTVVAIGGNQPEGGIDCDQNNLNITGGTLVATGGSNSAPTAASSTQCSVLLGGTAANTVYHLESENGEVLTFQTDTAYQSMVFSSPLLKTGETYTIYTGGNISGGSDFHGLYSDATYSDGTKGESFTISSVVTMQGGNTGMGGGGRMQGGGRGGMTPPEGELPQGELPQGQAPQQGEVSQKEISLLPTSI